MLLTLTNHRKMAACNNTWWSSHHQRAQCQIVNSSGWFLKHIKHFKIHIFKTLLKVNKTPLKWLELLKNICKKRDFWVWMLGITTETSGMHLYQGPSWGTCWNQPWHSASPGSPKCNILNHWTSCFFSYTIDHIICL